jgi:DNA-binding LytR/AlgR family response regulator
MNCILIDDEPLARQGLAMQLSQIPTVQLKGSYGNPFEAEQLLHSKTIDLMFLDINMPSINGLEYLRGLSIKPMVIFVTAYPQYALDSYELDAIDYLVKPVRPERLLKAVEKAARYLNLLENNAADNSVQEIAQEFIFVRSDRKSHKIFFQEIIFIEALKDYVIIHTAEKKVITAMNIKTMMGRLPVNRFIRISRSYIVNMLHIIGFDSYTVFLKSEELPIGNVYKEAFIARYVAGNYLKR